VAAIALAGASGFLDDERSLLTILAFGALAGVVVAFNLWTLYRCAFAPNVQNRVIWLLVHILLVPVGALIFFVFASPNQVAED
jgi:hypothetical protein